MRELWVRPERCLGCQSCRLACAVAHSAARNLYGALTEEPPPRPRVYVEVVGSRKVPLQCRQCRDAPCAAACPVQALAYDEATGLVDYRSERCIGCSFCVLACPFGLVVLSYDRRQVIKCDRCRGLGEPACAAACPTRALVYEEGAAYQSDKRRLAVRAAFGRADSPFPGLEPEQTEEG